MKLYFKIVVAAIALSVTTGVINAQQFYWSNLAGTPGTGGNGNGTGLAAGFNAPYATAVDNLGNVYVADSSNNTIRKLTVSGTSWTVTTLAGSPGVSGTADGTGTAAQFSLPIGIAVDGGGNVYVADSGNQTIRKVTSGGVVTTFAGTPGQPGFSDGTGSAASFTCPTGVAVDGAGNVYVADAGNQVIREITSGGAVTTLAGSPCQAGYADGTGSAVLFNTPTGVAVDGAGNVFVADNLNHVIRKIAAGGVVTTLAGTPVLLGTYDGSGSAAMFNYPYSVAVDSGGNIYVADSCNHAIRKVTPAGVVTTLAGIVVNRTSTYIGVSGTNGYTNGLGTVAKFYYPKGVSVDGSGNVYVADTSNNAIRKVTSFGDVTTIAGNPTQTGGGNGTGTGAQFNDPCGITVVGGSTVYVADTLNNIIRKVTPSGLVSTPVGWLFGGGSADGVGSAAKFLNPYGVASDGSGHLFVADTNNETIRMVTLSSSAVVTISGSVGTSGTADGTGAAALFNNPTGLATDASGNVYVADRYNNTIRKIAITGTVGVATTIAGSPGVSGTADGTGSAALFSYPSGVAVDSGTNIYVADSSNYTIRKLTLSGANWVSTTLAGTPGVSGSADGTGSAAQFGYPTGLAVDSGSNVYVADSGNNTIRKISPSGVVTTIGGTPGVAGAAAGIGSAGLFSGPYAVAVDSLGNVYVADSGNNRIAIGSCAGSGSAGLITGTGATLYGQANPEGATSGTAWFQYGTTTAYTSGTTAPQGIGGGTSFVPVSGTLTGLSANTTYHYQIVVITTSGTFYGTDQTFVTKPTAIPGITSAATATGTATLPFSYQIAASNSPTGFGASPLPAGLIVDPVSGLITGTPTTPGTTSVTLSATNAVNTGTKTLTVTIANLPLPVITSGTTAGGVLDTRFIYQIAATNNATSLFASGLPAGLSFLPASGLIWGVPTEFGTFSASISAVNAIGSGTVNLGITISPAYYWSNFAGLAKVPGSADGTGTSARFSNPYGVAVDSGSNVYVADTNNCTIRKITPAGVVTTLAGSPGVSGTADGTGSAAQFNYPNGVAVDSSGNVYVADTSSNTIRKITPAGVVTTLAGTPGVSGSKDGTGSAAQFNRPNGVAVDSGGNVYVADYTNKTIREVTPAGVVTTLAGNTSASVASDDLGSGAGFTAPFSIAVDSGGNLYVTDFYCSTVRKIMKSGTSWLVTTIGGTPGLYGSVDGLGAAAQFSNPAGIAVDNGGNVYVADEGAANNRIIKGVLMPPPVIGGTLAATGTVGSTFSYQIAASNNPSSYDATNLPSGLTVDTASGLISGTPTASGTFTPTLSATNLGGTNTATLTLTVLGAYNGAFNAWKAQKFTVTQLLNPAVSGDTAAPAGDGISNLTKYALGLNPNICYAISSVLPYAQVQAVGGTNYLTLTFTQNTAATDVTYSVEASTTLSGTWTQINPLLPENQFSVLPNTPSQGMNTITVKDVQPASASTRRFMRLRVTNP